MTPDNSIVLTEASKSYGSQRALSNVTLSVHAGERVALIGHNGAGKTTLMKLVLGLTRPSAGTVRVCGIDPAGAHSITLRRTLGYLPENVAFRGGMSGHATLRFYARLKGTGTANAESLLAEVGLADAAKRPVRTYSKGMRQRLGLAQALLGSPRVLVLDEPTTGLDPALRREFYTRLDALHVQGATTLVSSHSLAEIEGRTDRIAVMRAGRLVAFGTLDELRSQAGIPIRIRVRLAHGDAAVVAEAMDAQAHLQHVNDQQIELACLAPEKMGLLRRIAAVGDAVHDVDVTAPPLDEVYRYFTEKDPTQ